MRRSNNINQYAQTHLQGFLVIRREACTVYPVNACLHIRIGRIHGAFEGLAGDSTRSMYILLRGMIFRESSERFTKCKEVPMSMFCFQCEQTVGGKGCTKIGVCGKQPETSNIQDALTGALVGLARATDGKGRSKAADLLMMEGLFSTVTNVSFDDAALHELTERIRDEKTTYLAGCKDCFACGSTPADMPGEDLFAGDTDIVSLRSLLLLGLRGMAAYAYHAHQLGKDDPDVTGWLFKGMKAVGDDHTIPEWLDLLMEFGNINLKCMELLDEANTSAYGTPVPTTVTMAVEKGPFIVISGHDLLDLKQLLDQTVGKGVNVYTHGEMLPAHGYPGLKKYPQLKGNFGTAWQNQQKEFDGVPAAFLFTTNCLMTPKASYKDRVYTTAVVGFPGLFHIPETDGLKDFSPVIAKAIELGGWAEDKTFKGINGGSTLMTGFGHGTVLGVADKVIGAVKTGAIKHFFLVGGCDGAKPGRNYYTDFVAKSPKDSVILTLACGKFRFNDLDLGTIGGLPRIMDMGQCNDSYSAIKVAVALAEAFGCGVNELPLSIILSWYEQKAVCVLLTLLALGIKNIFIGPTLPAFVSPTVLNVLVEKWNLTPISTPEADLKKILG
jgi:hydroxylamine reductase